MGKTYSGASREQLAAELRRLWKMDEKEGFLQKAPREVLIAKLEAWDKVGNGQLETPAIRELIRMVVLGQLNSSVLSSARNYVDLVVGEIILAKKWGDEKASDACMSIYRILHSKIFGISERAIKEIAKKRTPKEISLGLEVWRVMRDMEWYVRPERGKKRKLVFTGLVKLEDWAANVDSLTTSWNSWELRQLQDYFQRNGGKPAKLEDIAIDAYLKEVRERGENSITRGRLKRALGKSLRFLRTIKIVNLRDGTSMNLDPVEDFSVPYSDPFSEKRQRFNRGEVLFEINKKIVELFRRGITARAIGQKFVADELGYGAIEKGTGEDVLRKRLRLCGVTEEWGNYVDRVIDQFRFNSSDRKSTEGYFVSGDRKQRERKKQSGQ